MPRPFPGGAYLFAGSPLMADNIVIRPATRQDDDAIWQIIEPMLRAGETYTLPSEISRDEALAYWFSPEHEVFIAETDGAVVGCYYLRANQRGGGSHVANCGYVTAQHATGRGIARAMCLHSLDAARQRGFRAMQFNFVVSTNQRAIHLWTSLGFATVGRLPDAFLHPRLGYIDALVMYRAL
jgi:ribosomal protein S18 acetylase RimI-like enzyme